MIAVRKDLARKGVSVPVELLEVERAGVDVVRANLVALKAYSTAAAKQLDRYYNNPDLDKDTPTAKLLRMLLLFGQDNHGDPVQAYRDAVAKVTGGNVGIYFYMLDALHKALYREEGALEVRHGKVQLSPRAVGISEQAAFLRATAADEHTYDKNMATVMDTMVKSKVKAQEKRNSSHVHELMKASLHASDVDEVPDRVVTLWCDLPGQVRAFRWQRAQDCPRSCGHEASTLEGRVICGRTGHDGDDQGCDEACQPKPALSKCVATAPCSVVKADVIMRGVTLEQFAQNRTQKAFKEGIAATLGPEVAASDVKIRSYTMSSAAVEPVLIQVRASELKVSSISLCSLMCDPHFTLTVLTAGGL